MTRLCHAFALSLLLNPACGNGGSPAATSDANALFAGGPQLDVSQFGARGDGRSDDTAAIQAAVDALPARATLKFPAGTYRIASNVGVRLKDDIRLDLGGATLVGPNVDGARCRLLEIDGGRNIVISGGTLLGSRSGSPQWGVGLLASDAEDLLIENVTFRDFFFDGILLTGNRGCRRVLVRGVTAENNRRTGLAAPAVSELKVEASTFRGSKGQSPQAGANCEPNAGGSVRNVSFSGSTFSGNAGVGLYIHRALGDAVSDASVQDSVMEGNDLGIAVVGVERVTIEGNRISGHRGRARSGIALGEGTTQARIIDNVLEENYRGIVSAGATAVEIRGNTVAGLGAAAAAAGAADDADGIVCRGLRSLLSDACQITGNNVRRVAGSGIVAQLVSRVRVWENTVEETGQRGIYVRSTTDSEVTGNRVSASGLESRGRYDAIELAFSANGNLVTQNTCRLGAGTRDAVGVGPGCINNRVFGNVVIPWSGIGGAEPGAVRDTPRGDGS